MADLGDERRDALHGFMQEQGVVDPEASGALLVGWVVVQAWVDPDGGRWLTKAHAAELPAWGADGLHHQALYGDWSEPSS